MVLCTLERLNYYAYEDVLVKKYYLNVSDKQKEDILKLNYPFYSYLFFYANILKRF